MVLKNLNQNAPIPSFKSVAKLFTEQVKKNPQKIAITFEDSFLTYEKLDLQSDLLAKHLIVLGVTSNRVVGLSLQNSLDLIIAILGILKSGATYLPIDPKYPIDRIQYMMEDAKPLILITEKQFSQNFIKFNTDIIFINELNPTPLPSNLKPIASKNSAYIFYTSGSTGKPKGIVVDQAALCHAIFAYRNYYPKCIKSLILSSISFDASILIILYTLLFGGTASLPNASDAIDGEKIITLVKKKNIDFVFCVPSFYKIILDKSVPLPSLKNVTLAGENLPNIVPDLHARLAPNAVLYNAYGPTEYAIGATIAKIYNPATKSISPVTIGKAFPDTGICILDENLRSLPNGAKGEIYISGKGLAKGYLNKPELTQEKFISIHLPDQTQPAIFYKTGDLGRFLPSGDIEFLGRIDYQVKIRGYRIELGEVEHALCQHPKVSEAIATVQEKENKQLVAFYSTREPRDLKEELKAYLGSVLPGYMIPSILYKVEQWPITPNGKIDRMTLLDLLKVVPTTAEPSDGPPPLEKGLFDIWSQVLETNSFSQDDNFFDLGGDSLQVARMQTLIGEKLGLEINIIDLFQYPTLTQLAGYLQSVNPKKELRLVSGGEIKASGVGHE